MRFLRAVALASLVVAGSAQAQGSTAANSACTGLAGDTCQQAVDFFYYMSPMLGTAITGGNTTLAQGGAMGGLRLGFIPRIAIDARLNAVIGNAPAFAPQAGAPSARAMTADKMILPMPSVDVALGVFKGIPLGVTNVGGVDLLASAAYVPKVEAKNAGDPFITPDKPISIGYGVRVGLLQESLVAPGIGFSLINRSMPKLDMGASSGSFNFSVNGLDLSSTAWRLTVSKSLLILGLAAGYGQDKYSGDIGNITAANGGTSVTTPGLKTKMTRSNMFVDLSLNLFVLKIVATGGIASGGDMKTFYTYDTPADEKRTYGSVGVRLGF